MAYILKKWMTYLKKFKLTIIYIKKLKKKLILVLHKNKVNNNYLQSQIAISHKDYIKIYTNM
jgi:hypothetical protein